MISEEEYVKKLEHVAYAARLLAIYLDKNIGMDKPELTFLWQALAELGHHRKDLKQMIAESVGDDDEIGYCDKCYRCTWEKGDIGKHCKLPQPCGNRCDGVFVRGQQPDD